MQQVSYPFDTTASTHTITDASPAYLTPPADPPESQALSSKNTFASTATASATATPGWHDSPASHNGPPVKAENDTSLTPLPSLLQYVDHILMSNKNRHNCPPYATQACLSCNILWDKASVPSTFLPWSPCNHWIHYRCLIELAVRGGNSHKGRCYSRRTPLYQWDGINALTLAIRTSLPMKNDRTNMISPSTYTLITSDRDNYEQECELIDNTIERRFFKQLAKPSVFSDNSPDLVQCFNDVLNELRLMGRPSSKWLTWSTSTGSLLFGMLVAIKTQRFLTEGHGGIKETEAWAAWQEGCLALQARILEDVRMEER